LPNVLRRTASVTSRAAGSEKVVASSAIGCFLAPAASTLKVALDLLQVNGRKAAPCAA
jgi:hypothetical protein